MTSDALILLPLFAVAIGTTVSVISKAAGVGGSISKVVLSSIILIIMLYPFYIFYTARVHIYTMNQVAGQVEAVTWIQNNLPDNALVVTDNYAFVALRQDMPNVHHYWKIDTDPDIKFTLLEDNHCNIDYVLTTPQVTTDIDAFSLDLMARTIQNSQLLLTFENEGWPVEIWQVSKQNCEIDDDFGNDLDERGQPTTTESTTPEAEPNSSTEEETESDSDDQSENPEITTTPEQL